jgi:hypothetical protein
MEPRRHTLVPVSTHSRQPAARTTFSSSLPLRTCPAYLSSARALASPQPPSRRRFTHRINHAISSQATRVRRQWRRLKPSQATRFGQRSSPPPPLPFNRRHTHPSVGRPSLVARTVRMVGGRWVGACHGASCGAGGPHAVQSTRGMWHPTPPDPTRPHRPDPDPRSSAFARPACVRVCVCACVACVRVCVCRVASRPLLRCVRGARAIASTRGGDPPTCRSSRSCAARRCRSRYVTWLNWIRHLTGHDTRYVTWLNWIRHLTGHDTT